MQTGLRSALVYLSSTVFGKYLQTFNISNINDVTLLSTPALLMMLLYENVKLHHAYSNHPYRKFSVNKAKRIGPFGRQMETVELVEHKGLSFRSCHGNKNNFMYRTFLT